MDVHEKLARTIDERDEARQRLREAEKAIAECLRIEGWRTPYEAGDGVPPGIEKLIQFQDRALSTQPESGEG